MSATAVLARVLCILCMYGALAELPKARFEYKLSFKGPHLVQRDNSIPFWEYSGGKCNIKVVMPVSICLGHVLKDAHVVSASFDHMQAGLSL